MHSLGKSNKHTFYLLNRALALARAEDSAASGKAIGPTFYPGVGTFCVWRTIYILPNKWLRHAAELNRDRCSSPTGDASLVCGVQCVRSTEQ